MRPKKQPDMLRVLLIEDDDIDQFVVRRLFIKHFPKVDLVFAMDGQEALEYLQDCERQPDGILVDINMPRMNGLEFLAEYNKIHSGNPSIVAMLSSSGNEKDKAFASTYAFVREYYCKPFKFEEAEEFIGFCQS